MGDLKTELTTIANDCDDYKVWAEVEIERLNKENKKISNSLAVLYNVIEVSGYINSFICKPNIIQLINDMIIGVLGTMYSTITLLENNEFVIKSTNISEDLIGTSVESNKYIKNYQSFIINCDTFINNYNGNETHSMIGVPLIIGEEIIGYILAEHTLIDFFQEKDEMFLGAIASQVSIALYNYKLYRKLEVAAETDQLLGILNRTTFIKKATVNLGKRNFKQYGIVMFDIDDFKNINDTYGHQFGDETLIKTTDLIRKSLEDGDLLGRYGGEELIVFINNVSSKDEVLNRFKILIATIENNIIEYGGDSANITVSLGIAFVGNDPLSLKESISEADKLLYNAKNFGKNRIESNKSL